MFFTISNIKEREWSARFVLMKRTWWKRERQYRELDVHDEIFFR